MNSMQGIQYFSSLEILRLTASPLLTIDLSKNVNLKKLVLMKTELYELDVSANTKLEDFIVYDGNFKELHLTNLLDISEMAFRGPEIEVFDMRGVTSIREYFSIEPGDSPSIFKSTPKLKLLQLNSAFVEKDSILGILRIFKGIYGEALTIEVYSSASGVDGGKPVYKLEDGDYLSDVVKKDS